VSLKWNASTDNVGVTAYDIYSGSNNVLTVSGTSATVSGLSPSTAYTFTVKARDAAGNTSGASSSVSVTTDAGGGGGTGFKQAAPYLYEGWGDPPNPSAVMSATGVKWFTMAFVLDSGGCNPAWDGSRPLTGGVDQTAVNQIRSAGGDIRQRQQRRQNVVGMAAGMHQSPPSCATRADRPSWMVTHPAVSNASSWRSPW
jgi:hypothetical protein